MRTLVLLFFLVCFFPALVPGQARTLMVAAASDPEAARRFYELYQTGDQHTPLQEGYKGLSEIMLCNFGFNPFTKFSRFLSGKATLEHAISRQPENTELHFLRFMVQVKCPPILQYRANMAGDKAILKAYLNKPPSVEKDEELTALIISFLQKTHTNL